MTNQYTEQLAAMDRMIAELEAEAFEACYCNDPDAFPEDLCPCMFFDGLHLIESLIHRIPTLAWS